MKIDLTGKTALVTGASRGIGEAAVRMMARCGANVVLAARSAGDIEKISAEIGDRARAVTCDVSRYSDVEKAVRLALESFGGLDILVNNAGTIEPIARLEESDPAGWDKAIDINVKGVYHGLHAAYPVMEENGGVIINMSSGAATSALEGWSHYCASKAAVLSLTRCAHKEWADQGIRVVGLSPGTVATEMQTVIKSSGINPVSKLEWSDHIPADWVAKAICWLTTDAARKYDGEDLSLKSDKGRRDVGLISL